MPLFTKNMNLGPAIRLSSWRKIALGTWRTARDPSVYGIMDFDAAPSLAYIEKLRGETGLKVTLSHVVGKAIAVVMQRHPEINCVLRLGTLYPRRDVDVFFQVATDKSGEDLSGMTVRQADLKSVADIAREMHDRVHSIRAKGDPSFKKMKKSMRRLPGFLVGPVLDAAEFLMYTLNLWTPLLGSPRDSFGGAMVTNVGSLGIETAFVPLVGYSRVPLLFALGTVRPMPVVREGEVRVAEQMRICATFDHRLIDGVVAGLMYETLKKILLNPEEEFNRPPAANKLLQS